jgi:hypothetical protein
MIGAACAEDGRNGKKGSEGEPPARRRHHSDLVVTALPGSPYGVPLMQAPYVPGSLREPP